MTELDQGLWLSVTQLAERRNVVKSTVSERVKQLVKDGLLTTKPGKGREKLINVAEYDTAIGEVGDGAREQGAATKAELKRDVSPEARPPSDGGRLRDEQTREKAYNADLKFIELEKARGNLLVVAEFDQVADDAAGRVVDIIEGLLARDTELTAVAVKEGENGMRAILKKIIRGQREAVVKAMKDMAANARARAAVAASGTPVQADLLAEPLPD